MSRDEDENGNIGLEVSPGKFFNLNNLVLFFGGGLGLNNNLNPFMPKDLLTKYVWTYASFENIFGINHKMEIHLKETSRLLSDQHFFFLYFLKIDFV